MTETPKYSITVKEAMEILDVSRKTIYRRLKSGELEGKKVITGDTKKWLISEDSVYDNKVINETVKLEEVNKPVNKDQLMNELVEAIQSHSGQQIDQAMDKVNDTIKQQNELLESQQQAINDLSEKVDQLNKSWLDKLKDKFLK